MGFVIDPKIAAHLKRHRQRSVRELDESLSMCERFGHNWVYDRHMDGRETCSRCKQVKR